MKKVSPLFACASIFLLALAGCAPLMVNSGLNSDFGGRNYKHLLVISFDQDQETAEYLEELAADQFKDNEKCQVKCEYKSKLFYAGTNVSQKYVQSKIDAYVEKNQIDGILVIGDGSQKYEGESCVGAFYKAFSGAEVLKQEGKKDELSLELFDAKYRTSVWYSRYGDFVVSSVEKLQSLKEKFVTDSLALLVDKGVLAGAPKKQ